MGADEGGGYRAPQLRPSKVEALKAATSGPMGTVLAIVMALLAAWQTYQGSQQTAKSSYETLRAAVEKNERQIAICMQQQINAQAWAEDLAARNERKAITVDKAVARVRPKAAPAAPPFSEEIPKPPEAPELPAPSSLPAFEALP
jgi:hypothetical protein